MTLYGRQGPPAPPSPGLLDNPEPTRRGHASPADPSSRAPAVAELHPRPVVGSTPNPLLRSPIHSVRVASFPSVVMALFTIVADRW